MTSGDVARVEGVGHDHADRAGVELRDSDIKCLRGGIEMPRQEERPAAGEHPGKVMIELVLRRIRRREPDQRASVSRDPEQPAATLSIEEATHDDGVVGKPYDRLID